MNQLVFIQNNRVLTDSLTVAEVFEKRHADVLRDIKSLGASEDFTQRNFAFSSYKDSTGRELLKYLITQDGFTLLAMGYTGQKAMEFKEAYINAFRQMESQLKPTSIEDLIILQAQSMKEIRQQLESTKMELASAHTEIKDIKQGLVDINEPLRKQFNDAVRSYKVKANIGSYDTAYNNVYNLINAQYHVNIQKRAENKGVRPIAIVEELNLLVPAIRLAKTLIERVNV